MKALLLYPEMPPTFWTMYQVMEMVGKKASYPPLGLLTIAALMPEAWEKRLVDLNVQPLGEQDLQWADLVFSGAMNVQAGPARALIVRCRGTGVRIVTGGLLFADDNLIGNKKTLKADLLPVLINWRQQRPPTPGFATQVTINLADDPELMQLMLEAGFRHIFIGIETPEEDSLIACQKGQNTRRDLGIFLRLVLRLGVLGAERSYFWKLLLWTIAKRPRRKVLALLFLALMRQFDVLRAYSARAAAEENAHRSDLRHYRTAQ